MKIRITQKPKLPKAQLGTERKPLGNFVTVGGVTYFEGSPGYAEAVQQADQGMASDVAELARLNAGRQPATAAAPISTSISKPTVKAAPQTMPASAPAPAAMIPAAAAAPATPPLPKMNGVNKDMGRFLEKINTPGMNPDGTMKTPGNTWSAPNNINTSMAVDKMSLTNPDANKMLGVNDINKNVTAPRTAMDKAASTVYNVGNALGDAVNFGSALGSIFSKNKQEQDYKNYQINAGMVNMDSPMSTTQGDYVQTGMMTGTLRPNEYTANKGMFAEAGGPINTGTMKIRIIGTTETMAYGGQVKPAGSLDVGGRNVYTQMPPDRADSISNTMPEASDEEANIEAELNETIYGDVDGDGNNELMNIGGKPHSQGGTKTKAPDESFVFSHKLKVKDPDVLKQFGKTAKKGGLSYADISKQYNLNKYKAIMENPNADPLAKATAQIMVKNLEKKLGQLAYAQEESKGFENGIPQAYLKTLPQAAEGGFLPSYQTTGEYIFTPEKQAQLKKLKEAQGYNFKYSNRVLSGDNTIDKLQHRQKSGLYGNLTDAELAEFKKRHEWYFKDRPNFNVADSKQVMDFQNQYETEAAKQGMSYFTGTRGFDAKDGKPGEYTYNAPVLYKNPATPKTPVVEKKDTPPVQYTTQAGEYNPKPGTPVPFGYLAPDMVNMYAAMANKPNKYNPFFAPVNLTAPDPTFYDPTRELAANAETYNQTLAGAANFGNPQGYMANASKASGDAMANAANIMGRYNNMNVGVANQASTQKAETASKQSMLDAERTNNMTAGYAMANQNFDDARRAYLSNIAKSYGNAFNNRMNTNLINNTIPQYYVDPQTGRTVFKKGYGPESLSRAGATANPAGYSQEEWTKLQQEYLKAKGGTDLTFNQYLALVGKAGKSTLTDNNMDGIADSGRYTGVANPFLNLNR